MTEPSLKAVNGDRDLLEVLEETSASVKNGELDAVIVVTVSKGDGISTGHVSWNGSFNSDALFIWSRMTSALQFASHELLMEDLSKWK